MSKDPKYNLQQAYYKLLQGQIAVDGTIVPVYDEMGVPSDPVYPYIAIGDITQNDWSDKTSFGEVVVVSMQVVDRATQKATRARVYEVSDGIKGILRARPIPFVRDPARDNLEVFVLDGQRVINLEDFFVITSVMDAEVLLPKELDDVYTYFGSSIRYRHYIEQLEPALTVLVDENGDILTDENGNILYG